MSFQVATTGALNHVRAVMGEPAYTLPSRFPSLRRITTRGGESNTTAAAAYTYT
jgi:hypothetical protein